MMDGLQQDLRYALRTLRKAPGFTAFALLPVALGTGASTGGVQRGQRRPAPGAALPERRPRGPADPADGRFSVIEIGDFSAGTRSLDAVAEYHSMPFQLYGRGEPQRVQTGVVSDVFFDILGVQPLLGRLFKQGEDAIGAPPMVVLSYRYWRERLGGDPTVIWCPCSSRS